MLTRKTVISYPVARGEGLLVESVGDETVIYDLSSKEAHCLKPLAAYVFAHCDGTKSASDIAELAQRELGQTVTEQAVADAVLQLEQSSLIDAPLVVRNGVSRREVVQKVAFASAAAVTASSLITTIVAPAAAATTSGIITGCTGCTKPKDCVSQHCCQGNPGKGCNQGCCVDQDNSCHVCPSNCSSPPCGGAGQSPCCTCTVVLSSCPTCTGGSVSCCATTSPC